MYRCIELKRITFIGGFLFFVFCFSFFYKEFRVLACARKYKFNGMLGLPAAFQLLDFGGNILIQKFEIEKKLFSAFENEEDTADGIFRLLGGPK
jgi:hypothetical protein